MYERPVMLHIGPCERKTEVGGDEYGEIWREWCLFKEKMNLKKSQEYQEEKEEMQSGIILGMEKREDNVERWSDEKNEEEDIESKGADEKLEAIEIVSERNRYRI